MSSSSEKVIPVTTLTVGLLLLSVLLASSRGEALDLDRLIQVSLVNFKGSVGIYAKNLRRNRIYEYHANDLFPTASVFKVPVLIEVFRRVAQGDIRLDDRRRVASGLSKHGNGVLKYLSDAPELTLRDYCRLMIILSDNMATDTLLKIATPESITLTMTKMGFPQTRVSGNLTTMHYRMYGISSTVGSPENDALLEERARSGPPLAAGLVDRSLSGNVTTPREMGMILERLHNGQVINREASGEMLELLKQNTNRSMIPRYLPASTVVAHKHGSTEGAKADVGIVYLTGGSVVISIFTYFNVEEQQAAGEVVARIAQIIIDQTNFE